MSDLLLHTNRHLDEWTFQSKARWWLEDGTHGVHLLCSLQLLSGHCEGILGNSFTPKEVSGCIYKFTHTPENIRHSRNLVIVVFYLNQGCVDLFYPMYIHLCVCLYMYRAPWVLCIRSVGHSTGSTQCVPRHARTLGKGSPCEGPGVAAETHTRSRCRRPRSGWSYCVCTAVCTPEERSPRLPTHTNIGPRTVCSPEHTHTHTISLFYEHLFVCVLPCSSAPTLHLLSRPAPLSVQAGVTTHSRGAPFAPASHTAMNRPTALTHMARPPAPAPQGGCTQGKWLLLARNVLLQCTNGIDLFFPSETQRLPVIVVADLKERKKYQYHYQYFVVSHAHLEINRLRASVASIYLSECG